MSLPPNDSLPLALRAGDAAKALGISERKLWELTNRSLIPHMRVGRSVVYPVSSLRAWLDDHAQKGTSV